MSLTCDFLNLCTNARKHLECFLIRGGNVHAPPPSEVLCEHLTEALLLYLRGFMYCPIVTGVPIKLDGECTDCYCDLFIFVITSVALKSTEAESVICEPCMAVNLH